MRLVCKRPRVRVADAKAWAAFTRALRREIAAEMAAGRLSSQLGAPAHIEADLDAALAAIDRLPDDATEAQLDLRDLRDLPGWLYYLRLVSQWVEQLHADGLLRLRPTEEVWRFERELAAAVGVNPRAGP